MNDRLLLDTQVVIWWRTNDPRLTEEARAAIATAPRVYVSAVSAWEVAIKSSLGKLRLPGSFRQGVRDSGFEELALSFVHAARYETLPPHHRDPFDRMLVAQALDEGLTLLTHDRSLESYDVSILWT